MKNTPSSHGRRIVVLGTGGTIAGSSPERGANLGYTAGTISVYDLLGGITAPEGFTLHAEQIAQLDSKDMDFATWHSLYERSEYWLAHDDVAGLIIVHGTDTIEETSYFLHTVIQSSKPIVHTCAMRPATSSAPDGPQNLCDAVAVSTTEGAAGAVVVCAGEIHGPLDVRKDHPYRLNAFGSGDAGPIGYVEEGQVSLLRPWPRLNTLVNANLTVNLPPADEWPRVEIVLSHAGTTGALVDTLVRERQDGHPSAVAGIVLGATGNGSLHYTLEQAALRAQVAGIEVVVAKRCADGRILPMPGSNLPVAFDLSPVKARIALLLKLCQAIDPT